MPERAPTLTVAAGLLADAARGVAHTGAPVPLERWQNAFVAVVVAGPLAGLLLVRRGHLAAGVALVTATALASLSFGVAHRYLLANPDRVDAIANGPWRTPFGSTAGAVAGADAAPVVGGARRWASLNSRAPPRARLPIAGRRE